MKTYGYFWLTLWICSLFWNSGRNELIELHAGVFGVVFCYMAVLTKQSTLFDLWNTYTDNSREQINRPTKQL